MEKREEAMCSFDGNPIHLNFIEYGSRRYVFMMSHLGSILTTKLVRCLARPRNNSGCGIHGPQKPPSPYDDKATPIVRDQNQWHFDYARPSVDCGTADFSGAN